MIISLAGLAGAVLMAVLVFLLYSKDKSMLLPYIGFFLCIGVFAAGAFLHLKGASLPFGSTADPQDLLGDWVQVNSNSEDMYHIATITEAEINIYWYTVSDGTKALYWAGSFSLPESIGKSYSWDSENNTAQTETALLASSDELKSFTYSNGCISYEVSALGVTQTVKLEKESQ